MLQVRSIRNGENAKSIAGLILFYTGFQPTDIFTEGEQKCLQYLTSKPKVMGTPNLKCGLLFTKVL